MLRERLQLHPFWQLENLGFIRPYGLGADEWGNRSFYIVIPLLGSLTVFYGRTLDRSKWFLDGAVGPVATYTSPDFRQEAKVHFDGDYDRLERTAPLLSEKEILTRAHIVEAVSYYD